MERLLFVARGIPGLGNVSPCIALAREFAKLEDFEVKMASYGLGQDFIRKSDLPFAEIEFSPGGFYPGLNPIGGLYPQLNRLVKEFKPNLIIGSGEFYLPLYCHLEKLRCCMLANLSLFRLAGGFFAEVRDLLTFMYRMCDLIVDNGIIASKEGLPQDLVQKIVFTGPLIREPSQSDRINLRKSLGLPLDKIIVLVTKGGGEEMPKTEVPGKGSRYLYRQESLKILRTAAEAFDLLKGKYDIYMVLVSGLGLEDDDRQFLRALVRDQIELVEFTAQLPDYIAAADIAIGRGGLNFTAECLYCRTPLVLLAVSVDDEAVYNSRQVASYGAAKMISTEQLTTELLVSLLTDLLADPSKTHSLVAESTLLVPENGVTRAARIIREALL